jgi:UDP-N-acetylglucosamine--N-acetylmuramyl-(pentapeptide) pyrophosphoryl-undecaprenol N-acetylglucosamine transferase
MTTVASGRGVDQTLTASRRFVSFPDDMIAKPLIVVTGGGSGGHTMVAAATISHLLRTGVANLAYIGSHSGVEGPTARRLGVPYFSIRTGKLRRASAWYRMVTVRNALDTFNVSAGLAQAAGLLRRLRPAIVLSTGGFVAVPVAWAAGVLGIPVILHEQTLQLGLANRLTAGIAQRIAVSSGLCFESLAPRLRRKATVTGTPVREGILAGDVSRATERFQTRANLPTVLITGGAQGAERLNRAVLESMPLLVRECNVVHQCGVGQGLQTDERVLLARAQALADSPGRYWVKPFLDEGEMADAYAVSSLVVGRSGAGTTNELAATGRPAILVPLVPTSGDEQTRIARRLEGVGAAVVVPNAELTGPRLHAEVVSLLKDPERMTSMSKAIAKFEPEQAAKKLAELVLDHLSLASSRGQASRA